MVRPGGVAPPPAVGPRCPARFRAGLCKEEEETIGPVSRQGWHRRRDSNPLGVFTPAPIADTSSYGSICMFLIFTTRLEWHLGQKRGSCRMIVFSVTRSRVLPPHTGHLIQSSGMFFLLRLHRITGPAKSFIHIKRGPKPSCLSQIADLWDVP